MRRFFRESSIYGKFVLLTGLLIAAPLAVVPFFPEDAQYISAFIFPALSSVVLGAAICSLAPYRDEVASEWQSPMQKSGFPVLFAWGFSFFAGALPFVIAGQLNFVHALFESISGWSTTGLTVVNVTELPHIFLFHRSFMQYCGGLGFILMVVLLVQGKQSMSLYNAEGHPEQLMPSLKRTARTILSLYTGFLFLGTMFFKVFGMKLFDAVCHTMSALSTAGFTTQANSIGTYGSVPIEIVTIFLMLIGSTNFAVLLLLVRRRFRQILRISELRFLIGMLLVTVPIAAFALIKEHGMSIGSGFLNALFGVVTTYSTTGYSTMNYSQWPPLALGILMPLMIIGGGTGSTAGGIKLSRTYLLFRITRESVRKMLTPSRRVAVLSYHRVQGRTPLDNALVMDTIGFVTCYMGVYIAGALLVTFTSGCGLFDAMFEFGSALGTVGISNGLTNAGTPTGTLVVEMFGMILGRLEVLIVFIGFYSGVRTLKRFVDAKKSNVKSGKQ